MKNIKKNKIVLYSLLSLMGVSLLTIGFSSFIIDGSVSDDSYGVTANLGDVIDNTIITTINDSECDYNISFDNLENGNGNITNGDKKEEDLEFKIVYTLQTTTNDINLNNYKVSVSINNDAKESYASLKDSNNFSYIDSSCLTDFSFTLPSSNGNITTNPIVNNVTNSVTYINNKEAKVTSIFSFKWGEKFNNTNPCYSTDINIGTYLNDFVNKCKNLKGIVVTITPSYIGGNTNE